MKFQTTILIATAVLSLTSCSDFLDQKPISNLVEENYYRNTAEVETGVFSCYDGLQQVYDMEFKVTELRSDNASPKNFEGDWGSLNDFSETSNNSFLQEFWAKSYYNISQANVVLKHLDNVTDATKKNYFEGEAKLIRGLMHFNMVRLWGDIPLSTAPIAYNEMEAFKRKPINDVYAQIIADLQDAIVKLPVSWTSVGVGRVTQGAAKGLLAKVYMAQNDFASAKPLLEQIIASNSYDLRPTFNEVFDLTKEMNKEIIFAVRFKANSNKEGNSFTYDLGKDGAVRGIQGLSDYRNLFVTTDATRKAVTFTGTDFIAAKFLDPAAPQRDAGNDFIVIRYADVLLMYAEVLNELNGPTAESLLPLNRVRARASATLPQHTLITLADKTAFRNAIKLERRLELGFENHRWYDLLRWGDAITVMKAHFAATRPSITTVPEFRLKFPIPQREIDLSAGMLTQNQGY